MVSKYNGTVSEKNSKNSSFSLIVMVLLVALVSAVGGFSFWNLTQIRQQQANAALIVLPEPRAIADFALIDQNEQPFSLENLRGKWSLLFFGFTHCPDICPSTLFDLQTIHNRLEQDLGSDAESHQVLFISVDPERDTPEKLKQYVQYFHADFIAVTGPDKQLAPLTRQLGIAYRVEAHEKGNPNYGVDHSASILVINPEGLLYGVFPAPHDAEKLATDLAGILD
jgi:protein SCO1/2